MTILQLGQLNLKEINYFTQGEMPESLWRKMHEYRLLCIRVKYFSCFGCSLPEPGKKKKKVLMFQRQLLTRLFCFESTQR